MRAIAERTSALRPGRHSDKEVYLKGRRCERENERTSPISLLREEERERRRRREKQGPKLMRVGTRVYKIFITRDELRHPNLDLVTCFLSRFLLLFDFLMNSSKGKGIIVIIVTSPPKLFIF